MKTTIETITPSQAAKWLEAKVNHDNRPIRQSQVEYLSREILSGKWQTTHQGIAFAKGGRLLDGQHRLAAIVLAGKAAQIQVTTGADEDTFAVLDCGVKRTHPDRIHLVNDDKMNRLICTLCNTFLRETVSASAHATSEIENAFLGHDGKMADSWVWVANEFKVKHGGIGQAGVLTSLVVYHFVNPKRAILFCEGYKSGADLPIGSPILALRRIATDNPKRADYWVSQTAMRQHLADRTYSASSNGVHVFSASEDMLGNKNSIRLIRERTAKAHKGAATKRAAKAKST